MKNKFVFFISFLVVILFLSGCAQKETQTPAAKEDAAKTSAPAETGITDCKGDQTCLHSNFLACSPAEFKIPFIQEGSEYSISVIGIENGKCHYKLAVSGQAATNCIVPMELITEDRFGHFFGAEKVPGKEKIAEEQQKIDADYCKQA